MHRNAVCRHDLSREKVSPKRPQSFRRYKYKNIISSNDGQSATATTAASGRNREELLGQRSVRCERRSRRKADAGCRNPSAAAIFNRAALPKALPCSLPCRNISRRDCPAPPQGKPAFPTPALPPALPSGQSGAVRRARRALSGTAWLTPLLRRWKQPRRSGRSRAPRRQPAGRRCPCSMHRGCRCSIG